jgi:hypothetical protein
MAKDADPKPPWNVATLAPTRAGHHQEAVKLLRESQRSFPQGYREQDATYVWRWSSASRRRGWGRRRRTVNRWRRRADNWVRGGATFDHKFPPRNREPRFRGHSWVTRQTFRREAEEPVKGLPKEPGKQK